jgi:hypothetical protein
MDINAKLRKIEKQIKGKDTFYCIHPCPPLIVNDGDEIPPLGNCKKCGKPFPPGTVRPVIIFEKAHQDEE